MFDKRKPVLPEAENDERALIGGILCDPEKCLAEIADLGLKADHFNRAECRDIFGAVVRMTAQGVPLEVAAITAEAGVAAGVATDLIENHFCVAAHARFHGLRIRDAAIKRDAVSMLQSADGPDGIRLALQKIEKGLPAAQTGVQAVDAAEWLTEPPPPHEPVLEGLFDRHSLVEVVGPSKVRKSFFSMQLALGLATGRGAFGFGAGRVFRVLVADLELTEADLRRRLWRMATALQINPADLGNNLRFATLAGTDDPQTVIDGADAYDVLLVDPLYLLSDGDEGIADMRGPLKWMRKLATRIDAVVYIHHDAKGFAGERQTRDRGSGSGITGRAVDARMTLTPCSADPDTSIVLGFMCRSYITPEPSVWTFADGAFVASDLPAEAERASDKRTRSGVKFDPDAVLALASTPLTKTELHAAVRAWKVTERDTRAGLDGLLRTGKLVERKGGDRNTRLVGTPQSFQT